MADASPYGDGLELKATRGGRDERRRLPEQAHVSSSSFLLLEQPGAAVGRPGLGDLGNARLGLIEPLPADGNHDLGVLPIAQSQGHELAVEHAQTAAPGCMLAAERLARLAIDLPLRKVHSSEP